MLGQFAKDVLKSCNKTKDLIKMMEVLWSFNMDTVVKACKSLWPWDPGLLLKVHKIEIFFGFDFEICIISLLVMSKY
jgi:hypothetical protein